MNIQGVYQNKPPSVQEQHIKKKITLKCSKCGASLITVAKVDNPPFPEGFTLRAECGICKDHSFDTHVDGFFIYGSCEPEVVSLLSVDMEFGDDGKQVVVFKTAKKEG